MTLRIYMTGGPEPGVNTECSSGTMGTTVFLQTTIFPVVITSLVNTHSPTKRWRKTTNGIFQILVTVTTVLIRVAVIRVAVIRAAVIISLIWVTGNGIPSGREPAQSVI